MPIAAPELWAKGDHGIVAFPAFVHFPAPAHANGARPRSADQTDLVKCIQLEGRTQPHIIIGPRAAYFKEKIAARFRTSVDNVAAIIIDYGGKRVLIEDIDDWEDWVASFFHTVKSPRHPRTDTPGARFGDPSPSLIEVPVGIIDIYVLLKAEQEEASATASASRNTNATSANVASSQSTRANDSALRQPLLLVLRSGIAFLLQMLRLEPILLNCKIESIFCLADRSEIGRRRSRRPPSSSSRRRLKRLKRLSQLQAPLSARAYLKQAKHLPVLRLYCLRSHLHLRSPIM